jgi:hypothetical protein
MVGPANIQPKASVEFILLQSRVALELTKTYFFGLTRRSRDSIVLNLLSPTSRDARVPHDVRAPTLIIVSIESVQQVRRPDPFK